MVEALDAVAPIHHVGTTTTAARPWARAAGHFSAGKAADMPRKPNYNFERQERDRLKALETARKREAKRLRREAGEPEPSED